MGDLIRPGSRKIEEMAAGNAKEIMGGARLLLHPADMGGIEPGRLSACDDGDMDLDPGRAKPGDRAAAAQYPVVGMGRYDPRPPHILKGAHRAAPSMLWRRGGGPEAIWKSVISSDQIGRASCREGGGQDV